MINRPRINHPDPHRPALGVRGPLSHKVFPVLRALLRVGQGLLVDLGGLHDVLRMFTDLVDVANVLGDVRWRVVLNFAHNAKTFRRSKRGLKKPRRNLRKIRKKFILNIININLNIKPRKFIVKIQYFSVLK